jgi:hypothetical protein
MLRLLFWWASLWGREPPVPEQGGVPYDAEKYTQGLLRADLCAVATRRCYQHGARVVDDILANFNVSRQPLKEKKKP